MAFQGYSHLFKRSGLGKTKTAGGKKVFFKMSSSGNISERAPHYLFYFTTAFLLYLQRLYVTPRVCGLYYVIKISPKVTKVYI